MILSRRRQAATEPAPHGGRADQTFERLRDLIVRGRVKPGARLQEAAVAVEFGVSRTPVREALDRLARERFLIPSSQGMRVQLVVAPLAPDDIHELWTLRGALEGVAILAVSKMGRDSRRQLAAAMAEINDELADLTRKQKRDVDGIGELMSEFHTVFIDACAEPRTRAFHESLRPHVQRYEWAYGAEHSYEPSIVEHRAICEAVGRGDGERARLLLEQHWANGIRRTTEQFRRRLQTAR
jgi:DNA-binding GntR family transcriptional regulator